MHTGTAVAKKGKGTLVVLGTGGTIAGTARTADDNIGYASAQIAIETLVPTLVPSQSSGNTSIDTSIITEQIAQIDSKDMDFAVWRTLALRCQAHLDDPQVSAIIITHGTDTLEETAWFLHCVLEAHKPVVLTCAMRPATALSPDGPQNLRDAFTVARTLGVQGVWVVCAGEVHTAQAVHKVHPYRPNAFSSGESGPLGWVEEKSLRLNPYINNINNILNTPLALIHQGRTAIKNIAIYSPENWPRVEVTMSYVGASGATVDALVASGVQGLVVVGTGNATIHTALHRALCNAQAQGVAVRVVTRCPLGQTIAGPDGESVGFVPMPCLSPAKARISLMLELLHCF